MKQIIQSISEYFSDSDKKSIRRLLAFEFSQIAIFIGLLLSIKNGLVNMEGAAHVLQSFLVLIAGLLGFTTMQKLPSAIEFIKNIRKRKPEPAPAPGADDDLKDVDVPEPTPVQPEIKPKPAPPVVAPKKTGTKQHHFVKAFYQYAVESQKTTGINAIAIMAQAALESGWNPNPPGNMLFGIKAKPTDPAAKRQLILTTEILRGKGHKFPEVISITPTEKRGLYKYRVKDWFRKYATPAESFTDHAQFFFKNKRYAKALEVRQDADKFIEAIAAAGYATDPSYASKLKKIARQIESLIVKI